MKPVLIMVTVIGLLGLPGGADPARAQDDDSGATGARPPVWLGVGVQPLDAALREAFDLDRPGVLVNRVIEGSPADQAGLRTGDIITRVDGRSVESAADLRQLLQRHGAGRIEIHFVRHGRERFTDAVLRPRFQRAPPPSDDPSPPAEVGTGDELAGAYLGLRLEPLSADLAPYFAVRAGAGVLILEVVEGSPGDRAGIKGGDVVTRVDGARVRSPGEINRLIEMHQPGDDVTLEIVRRGRHRDLLVTLGECPMTTRERHPWPDFDSPDWHRLGSELQDRLEELRRRLDDKPIRLELRLAQLEELVRRLQEELARQRERAEQQSADE